MDEINLRDFVSEAAKRSGTPGVAVGILHKGKTAVVSFGVTSVEDPLPVTDETLFQIGSITKTFTATAIMRLVEMRKLDLDAAVQTYLPDFTVKDRKAASEVTIRHLLTHTGGWEGDFYNDTGSGDDALEKYMVKMAELEQLAPVGEVYSYCNPGYSLMGLVIERVTGKTYQTAIRELVLDPIGMDDSCFEPGDVVKQRFTVGHHLSKGEANVIQHWQVPQFSWPAGGITCHIKDLLKFARFHLRDSGINTKGGLLSKESILEMKSPQVTIWRDEKAGLSWQINNLQGDCVIWHSGGTFGHLSFFALIPDQDFVIAVLTNARGGSVIGETYRWALRNILGKESPEYKSIEVSEQELDQYIGRYRNPSLEIELSNVGKKLIGQVTPLDAGKLPESLKSIQALPPIHINMCEKDRMLLPAAVFGGIQTGEIVRKPDGSIGWLRAGGRIHVRIN